MRMLPIFFLFCGVLGCERKESSEKGSEDNKAVHSTRPSFSKDMLEAKLGGIGAVGRNKCVPVNIFLQLKGEALDAAAAESVNLNLSMTIDSFKVGDTAGIYSDSKCEQLISADVNDGEKHGPYKITIPSGQANVMVFIKGSNTRTDSTISQVTLSLTSEDISIAENYDRFTGSISDEFSGETTKFEVSSPSPTFVETCHWLFVHGNNESPVLYMTGVDIAVTLSSSSDQLGFFSDKDCSNPITETVLENGRNSSLIYFLIKKEHAPGSAIKINLASTNPALSGAFDFNAPEFQQQ